MNRKKQGEGKAGLYGSAKTNRKNCFARSASDWGTEIVNGFDTLGPIQKAMARHRAGVSRLGPSLVETGSRTSVALSSSQVPSVYFAALRLG